MSNLRTNVPIGAHWVLWTPNGGSETNLGYTAEGVVINIAATQVERTVHELAAPFDAVLDDISITSEVILKEVDIDKLAAALNGIKTTVAGPPAKTGFDLSPARGVQANFGKLVFRPRSLTGLGGTDLSKDKTIHNALVMGSSDRVFQANVDNTITLSVKAGAYWDSVASKWRLYTEGDPTAHGGFSI